MARLTERERIEILIMVGYGNKISYEHMRKHVNYSTKNILIYRLLHCKLVAKFTETGYVLGKVDLE
jgi:hypothetical protein